MFSPKTIETVNMSTRPTIKKRRFGRFSRRAAKSSSWMLSATPGLMATITLVRDASWAGRRALINSTAKAAITEGKITAALTAG